VLEKVAIIRYGEREFLIELFSKKGYLTGRFDTIEEAQNQLKRNDYTYQFEGVSLEKGYFEVWGVLNANLR